MKEKSGCSGVLWYDALGAAANGFKSGRSGSKSQAYMKSKGKSKGKSTSIGSRQIGRMRWTVALVL